MKVCLDRQGHYTAAHRHNSELWRLSRVQSSPGGTTEVQKEIIARGLGL